jgi:hypothetical protein
MNSYTYTLTLQCTRCSHIWDDTFPNYASARLTHKTCPNCDATGLAGASLSPIRNLGRPRRPAWWRPKGVPI